MTNTLRTKQVTPIIPLPKTFSFIQNGITEFDSILSLFNMYIIRKISFRHS